ncbi:FMN-binding negative transcriptional regulator [Postechiella marina]|uniref:FMN-binding negative transcriptional regulator n=1 Tax=Postechiella marina TaxID=943941 RepID=A0ABP8CFS3_9FLAO
MKYPPKHHQDNNINHMLEVIKAYPLATVISVKDNAPLITHLPLIYNTNGKLIGHIDKYNPQTPLLKNNNEITLIFSGPECYISPNIYTTKQLPTYNYIKVHIKGTVKEVQSKEALKNSLIKMTEFLEAPDHKYTLEPNNKAMDSYLDYIKMFEITITNWEGKFKLSQDKTPEDIEKAKNQLIKTNQANIASFLNKIV